MQIDGYGFRRDEHFSCAILNLYGENMGATVDTGQFETARSGFTFHAAVVHQYHFMPRLQTGCDGSGDREIAGVVANSGFICGVGNTDTGVFFAGRRAFVCAADRGCWCCFEGAHGLQGHGGFIFVFFHVGEGDAAVGICLFVNFGVGRVCADEANAE